MPCHVIFAEGASERVPHDTARAHAMGKGKDHRGKGKEKKFREEEEEDEEEPDEHPKGRGVGGQGANAGMMPPSDDDSEEEEEAPKGRKVGGQSKNAGMMPPSDDEDDDDDDSEEDEPPTPREMAEFIKSKGLGKEFLKWVAKKRTQAAKAPKVRRARAHIPQTMRVVRCARSRTALRFGGFLTRGLVARVVHRRLLDTR